MSAVGPSDTRCHGSGGFAIQTPRDQGLQAAHYSAAHIMNASAAAAEQPVSYNKNAASSSGAVWNKRMSDLCTSVQVLDAFVHQQPRETQQDSRETAEVDHNIAIGRTLLVRNIAADVPVTSAASDSEQYGEYENEDSLKKCFLPFGSVVTVTVRHRIQKVESGELKNTSWALVTMARHSETKKILEAAASGKVKAGINELHIELLNEDKAIRSSGQMAQIWTKHKLLVGSSSGRSRKYLAQRPSRSSSLVRALPDFVLLAGKVRNISAPRFRSGSQSVLAVMSCPSWPAHPRHFTSQNLLPGGPRTPRIASTSHLPSHLQSPRGRPCGACSRCCCCLLAALSLELYSASILPEYSSADIALQGDPYTPSTHTSLESPCNGGIDGYFTSEHGLSQ
jgi:hypothetical protein